MVRLKIRQQEYKHGERDGWQGYKVIDDIETNELDDKHIDQITMVLI